MSVTPRSMSRRAGVAAWALLGLIVLAATAVRLRLLDIPLDRDEGERQSVLEHVWGPQLDQAAIASMSYAALRGWAKRSVDRAHERLWGSSQRA